MKKLTTIFATFVALSFLASCDKEEGSLPNIELKTGTGYTSGNATVGKNQTLLVGITASNAVTSDVLKSFDASRIYDGGSSYSFYSESLSVQAGDEYKKDFNITTRDEAGTEKYTFTVTNKDGYRNSVSVTLTVK